MSSKSVRIKFTPNIGGEYAHEVEGSGVDDGGGGLMLVTDEVEEGMEVVEGVKVIVDGDDVVVLEEDTKDHDQNAESVKTLNRTSNW